VCKKQQAQVCVGAWAHGKGVGKVKKCGKVSVHNKSVQVITNKPKPRRERQRKMEGRREGECSPVYVVGNQTWVSRRSRYACRNGRQLHTQTGVVKGG